MKHIGMFAVMCPEVPLHGTRFLALNFLGHASELLGLSDKAKAGGTD